jgi:two-component system chemotaxis response regulator CheB
MSVAVAADPFIAMRKMKTKRPDVIILDLEMPRMDGLTFLRRLMAEDPIPVVVCSSHAGRGTSAALKALEEGAVEVLGKPKLGVRDFLHESAVVLLDTVLAAAQARVPRTKVLPPPEPRLTADAVLAANSRTPRAVLAEMVAAIGASTGGPEALKRLLESMPSDAPGIVIVQHMPEHFTAAFAHRLNQICRIKVKEAADGDRVVKGQALIAPGNRHIMLVRNRTGYGVKVADGPLVSRHRPSVDVLFRSVAQAAGPSAVGVIMTGMGDDGAEGLLEMKHAQAATIAQDEASCVVFGMPKEAIARGGVDEVVPLTQLAATILNRVEATQRNFHRDVGSSLKPEL